MEPGKSYCKSQGNRTFVLDLFGSSSGILEMSSYDILYIYIYISIMQYIYITYVYAVHMYMDTLYYIILYMCSMYIYILCCMYIYIHIYIYALNPIACISHMYPWELRSPQVLRCTRSRKPQRCALKRQGGGRRVWWRNRQIWALAEWGLAAVKPGIESQPPVNRESRETA
jgi:hypothetical protein